MVHVGTKRAHNDKASSFDPNRLRTALPVFPARRAVAICKSCLALSNDLCIMEAGDNIFGLLQGCPQDLHIHSLFAPSPVFFFFHHKL